jgi:hypothetical protein
MNYFSIRNNWWNRSTVWWTESRVAGPHVQGTSLNTDRPSGDLRLGFKKWRVIFVLISIVEYQMDGQDLIWWNVFLRSNLSHLCCDGWSGWVTSGRWHRTLPTAVPSPLLTGGALACATVAKLRWGWVLRHRNDKLRPFVLTLVWGEW